MKFSKNAGKPIMPEIEVRIGWPASMPVCAMRPGCRSCVALSARAARLDAEAGEAVVDDLGRDCSSCR